MTEYYSTNGLGSPTSLRQAVMRGLAPDGGLYLPTGLPHLPPAFFKNISGLTFSDIAYVVANTLMGEIDSSRLRDIVKEAYNYDVPLRRLRDNVYGLELFHGPTLSFKDFGARFLARLVAYITGEGRDINVIVATAGDSGGAVANAFYGMRGVNVYVLYPLGQLSRLQETQFTTLGRNIHPLAVNGDFDDCQALVKSALADEDLRRRVNLLSANSINAARLIPQTFYYFHAYASLPEEVIKDAKKVVIAVPSGNLGNLTAGVIAWRMGLPVSRFVAVNNANDIFHSYLEEGQYTPRTTVKTLASSMDVGRPSNFARLQSLYGGSREAMKHEIRSYAYTDDAIARTMIAEADATGYRMDPHSAIAYRALIDDLAPGETGIFLETAATTKFGESVEKVTGERVELPPKVRKCLVSRGRSMRIAPRYDALRRILINKKPL